MRENHGSQIQLKDGYLNPESRDDESFIIEEGIELKSSVTVRCLLIAKYRRRLSFGLFSLRPLNQYIKS